MDSSVPDDRSDEEADLGGQPGQPPRPPRIPVAGKEAEGRETAKIEALLHQIEEVEEAREELEREGTKLERERAEELLEFRPPPEEEEAEISPEMEQLGVQAVPAVAPPHLGDDDDLVITLPLTEEEIEEGLHHKVRDSIRWLAEWCVRVAKLAQGKVRYAGE